MSYNWRLHESGSGSTVLLLHAFPFDARMWDAQMKALAASHRVIAPDMPGFGGSPPWLEAPNLDSWASSLLERLRADGVQDAIVAGCSVGGYFAFAMLRTASNFIRGLALVDTRAIADTPGRKAARLADAERIAREGRAFFIDAARKDLSVELAAYTSALAAANAMLRETASSAPYARWPTVRMRVRNCRRSPCPSRSFAVRSIQSSERPKRERSLLRSMARPSPKSKAQVTSHHFSAPKR
jgi:pimeloyl-ACP methyl ester carboxylesterase